MRPTCLSETLPKSSKARLEKGTPETKQRMKELATKAAAARVKPTAPPVAAVSLAPDLNEFNGQSKSTFGPQGTFFNPHVVFDPRISFGAPFPDAGGK